MRIALAIWKGRISPVFDVSQQILILDVEEGVIINKSRENLADNNPNLKAANLAASGVHTLICGALSREVEDSLATYGIETISFIAGDVGLVVSAYMNGELSDSSFCMPGCDAGHIKMRERGA